MEGIRPKESPEAARRPWGRTAAQQWWFGWHQPFLGWAVENGWGSVPEARLQGAGPDP